MSYSGKRCLTHAVNVFLLFTNSRHHLFVWISYLLFRWRCSPLNPNLDCDLGDGVSLAVEVSCSSHLRRDSDVHSSSEPPVGSSCVSQVSVCCVSSHNQNSQMWMWSCVVCGAEDCESRDRQWLWKLLFEPVRSISPSSTHWKVKREENNLAWIIWPEVTSSVFVLRRSISKWRCKWFWQWRFLLTPEHNNPFSPPVCSSPALWCSSGAVGGAHHQGAISQAEGWVNPISPFLKRSSLVYTEIRNLHHCHHQELSRSYECHSCTTFLSLSSVPAWMLWTGTALWTPAPVTGQCGREGGGCEANKCQTRACVLFLCAPSEAILALQTEVSRLKKDLEEGLVQLPHLAQRMDDLTTKYREERQERRSKIRTPTSSRQKT